MISVRPGTTAPYVTRILVRRPAEDADFNGTVVVEWLNVSGGVDANPDYSYLGDEIHRGGVDLHHTVEERMGVKNSVASFTVPLTIERPAVFRHPALSPPDRPHRAPAAGGSRPVSVRCGGRLGLGRRHE